MPGPGPHNNIYALDNPWLGAQRRNKPYSSGTILTAEKVSGEWVFITDFPYKGWIHKDNLRPLAR